MLYLRTLGGLSLENGGRPVVGAAAQRGRLAILAVLATEAPRGVSRDRLLALFWPESDTERARGALKQALYALRRDVAEQELTLGTSELRLNPEVIRSDVEQFQAAVQAGDDALAVQTYRGAFLNGIHLREAPDFERWLDAEQQRLAGQYHSALERLAQTAQQRGDVKAAVEYWRKLSAADPLSATAAASLMNALVSAGDAPAALRHGQLYAAYVEKELETAPDPSIVELSERIRTATKRFEPNGKTGNGGGHAATPQHAPIFREAAPERALPADTPVARRKLARLVLPAAIALSALLGVLAFVLRGSANPGLVLVLPFENLTGDSTLDRVGQMAADWVGQGLAQTGLVPILDSRTALRSIVVSDTQTSAATALLAARRTRATTIVQGSLYLFGDTIKINTRLIDGDDGTVQYQVDAVAGPATDPSVVIEAARQRVLGAFAAFSNSRFAAWADALSRPPRYDAYLEFVAGLENMIRYKESFSHFITAARLDTTFVQAKLFALETDQGPPQTSPLFRDSLIRSALAGRDRLSPFDRISLDRQVAAQRRDWEATVIASRDLVRIAPVSIEAAYWLVSDAMRTNRFHEASQAVHRLRATRDGFDEGLPLRNLDLNAHHLAGDFQSELAELQRPRASGASSYRDCALATAPLAALGREASVDSLIAVCQALPDAAVPGSAWFAAGNEYHAHGHRAAERRALGRARHWYTSQNPPWNDTGVMLRIDWILGDWKAVLEDVQEGLAMGRKDPRIYAQWGAAAAHVGERATALAMDQRLVELGANPMDRAMIHAALGDRELAVQLVRDAISGGVSSMLQFQHQPGFDPMRGFEPFDALMRPRR